MNVCLSAVARGGQKRASDNLELGSQVVLSLLMRILGTELRLLQSSPFPDTTEPPLQLHPGRSACVLEAVFTFAL